MLTRADLDRIFADCDTTKSVETQLGMFSTTPTGESFFPTGTTNNLGNRANSNWKKCQYIILSDLKGKTVAEILTKWPEVVKGYQDQYLIFNLASGVEIYDYSGNLVAKELEDLVKENNLKTSGKIEVCSSLDEPLQQIFYGAPGTGKSFRVNNITSGSEVVRTIFHPDSDYSTFVGCYKPETDDDGKVTYAFTQQAFTEAYIKAWKHYCGVGESLCTCTASSDSPSSSTAMFGVKDGKLVISQSPFARIEYFDEGCVVTYKEVLFSKNRIKKVWNDLWKTGQYVQPTGSRPGRSVQEAVCNYLKETGIEKDRFDEGWAAIPTENTEAGKYYIKLVEDKLLVMSKARNLIDTLKEGFNKPISGGFSIKKCIIRVLKSFGNDFDNSLERLKTLVNPINQDTNSPRTEDIFAEDESTDVMSEQMSCSPVYLVIEEINRGNCAQIFGDLFQLLDRNKDGFSEYPIRTDKDLAKSLSREFEEVDFSGIGDTVDKLYKKEFPNGVISKVQSGELLILPCTLNILATMNTSDQSLFPMDSAFKRRWEWVYVAVDHKDAKQFRIQIGENIYYNWDEFITKANDKIFAATQSADKQLGNRFCKADDNKVIDCKQFVNKVMFYLWEEVCKDSPEDEQINFMRTKNSSIDTPSTYFTFQDLFEKDQNALLKGFMTYLGIQSEEEKAASSVPSTDSSDPTPTSEPEGAEPSGSDE